jgi:hypothetical protein
MQEKFHFFVGTNRLESDDRYLTGAAIKQLAGANPADGLLLEGHGNNPDTLIKDAEKVDLSPEDGGVKRFRLEPPANFGMTI